MRRQAWFMLIAAVAFALLPVFASADSYPNRPVRIIVGYAPGGSVDIVGRIIAEKLSQRMGQQFYVDNRPGGGTIIASDLLARSAPDGYTLMLADIALGANPALHKTLPFNTEKSFAPIVLVAKLPAILAVEKSIPVKNLQEFIAYAKSKKGQLNYSSSGVGSLNYLASELFKADTGVDITHIPYQSGGQATTALLAGFVQMLITTVPPIIPHADKVKFLAVSSKKRLESLPNVPTFAEAGLPAFDAALWQGFVAPAGTDKKIIEQLNKEVNAVIAMPEVRARLLELGGYVEGGSSDAFAAFIASEIAKWKAVFPTPIR